MVAFSLVVVVAVIHFVIAATEIFLWWLPQVHGRLDYDAATAAKVAPIVANAGLYNGFLAVGLLWSLTAWGSPNAQLFFLACVIVAGIFGAVTLKWTTVVLQSVPGALAWLFVWMPD